MRAHGRETPCSALRVGVQRHKWSCPESNRSAGLIRPRSQTWQPHRPSLAAVAVPGGAQAINTGGGHLTARLLATLGRMRPLAATSGLDDFGFNAKSSYARSNFLKGGNLGTAVFHIGTYRVPVWVPM